MPENDAVRRYRCNACGNLTRFDVTSTRRATAFHHFDVSGALEIEDEVLLDERIESVSCRWCGNASAVTEVGSSDVAAAGSGPPPEG